MGGEVKKMSSAVAPVQPGFDRTTGVAVERNNSYTSLGPAGPFWRVALEVAGTMLYKRSRSCEIEAS